MRGNAAFPIAVMLLGLVGQRQEGCAVLLTHRAEHGKLLLGGHPRRPTRQPPIVCEQLLPEFFLVTQRSALAI